MVSGFDMGTIQGLNQLGGKGGTAGQQPMNAGKPVDKKPDPNGLGNPVATQAPGAAPLKPGAVIDDPVFKGAGSTDLASPPVDTSGGLGEMGSQDKLNMIAKMYRGIA